MAIFVIDKHVRILLVEQSMNNSNTYPSLVLVSPRLFKAQRLLKAYRYIPVLPVYSS